MIDLPTTLARITAEPMTERHWLALPTCLDDGEFYLEVVLRYHRPVFAATVQRTGQTVEEAIRGLPARDLRRIARRAREDEERRLASPGE